MAKSLGQIFQCLTTSRYVGYILHNQSLHLATFLLNQYDTPPLRDVNELRQASTIYVRHESLKPCPIFLISCIFQAHRWVPLLHERPWSYRDKTGVSIGLPCSLVAYCRLPPLLGGHIATSGFGKRGRVCSTFLLTNTFWTCTYERMLVFS